MKINVCSIGEAMIEISNIKNGEPIPVNQFSGLVTATGVEPTTAGAEIQCSIQLSYAAFIF